MNRIAGLPNTESNRALDMYMKTRYFGEAVTALDLAPDGSGYRVRIAGA
jgi:N12 class adenine-specific DNA methylase